MNNIHVPRTLDLGSDSPKTLSARNMSDNLALELITTLDLGDFELTDWETEFVESLVSKKHFTDKQKEVIYKLAFKFKLL